MSMINKVRVDNIDYDIENIYPTELNTSVSSADDETIIDKEYTCGDIATAATNSVTTAGTFWLTDHASEMVGKKLTSVTLNAVTEGGTITFRANSSISVDKNISNLSTLQEHANTINASSDTFDMFQLKVNAGVQTYLLDGTDSRVTILNQDAVDSCPLTIGVVKSSDTSAFKFNQDNLENEGTIRFFHSLIGSASVTGSQKSGLGIIFGYQDIEISSVATYALKMVMNNGDELEVDLSKLNVEEIELINSTLTGKKISILGDSISTYDGYIPTGYATFYPANDITSVEKTWWYSLIEETGMELVTNASWSGSYVTGDSTSTSNALAGCSTARVNALANGTTKPDIILVYIGINDFGQSVHRQLGDYTGETTIPNEGTITTFSEAYGLMIKKILATYPKAKVYCCTLLETTHSNFDTTDNGIYPTANNNNVALGKFNERIKTIASNLGARVIDLHSCGINYWNVSTFTGDLLHPNSSGAELIKDKVKNVLIND